MHSPFPSSSVLQHGWCSRGSERVPRWFVSPVVRSVICPGRCPAGAEQEERQRPARCCQRGAASADRPLRPAGFEELLTQLRAQRDGCGAGGSGRDVFNSAADGALLHRRGNVRPRQPSHRPMKRRSSTWTRRWATALPARYVGLGLG